MYFNLKAICAASPHDLTVHWISTTTYIKGLWRCDQNWRSCAGDKVKNRSFQLLGGRNSKVNYLTVFKYIWYFIHVYLICKFQDDPIKSDDKVKYSIFLIIKGGITLRQSIRSGQVSISSEILYMSIQDMMTTKSTRRFCWNKGNVTLRLMIQSGQFLNLLGFLSVCTLSASYRNIRSKLNK